jgi:biotin carboxyl carrier protein
MTYDVAIDGRPARLSVEGTRFRYERGEGENLKHDFSIEPAGLGRFSVLAGARSYEVTLLSSGEISVNGRVFRVEAFDPRGLRARERGGESQGRQKIVASMPGRVIRVLVELNQEVEAGQGLIVVEAMKMQNEMKSPQAGKVVGVKTAPGAAVAAGEVLVEIE